ncbi:MAG: nitronate monooxygenase [Bacteroidota bacterium]|nr:nitronate monooxygenase [Bacteroidota bacterium]MDP4232362.1 nitronate monooxygenase [Bacteroidota bacterium]MDP4241499.1 nitronate monooxygenase [Bacteroidota bacterium]MDP4289003.1 nitronate monooxygenase [Bacteroidota bacterium]
MQTTLSRQLGIRYPIVQAGMVWTSGWKLAVASARAGALGLIGAGSMKPDVLREHIRKARTTEVAGQIGVNIALTRGDVEALVETTIEAGVRIVFTSAGNPKIFTQRLKNAGCFVAHLVASVKHARKAEEAGCDAVVTEGFEAGGHNGIDEITTLCLVPEVVDAVKIPVIAAGGIADGRQILACLALGAQAVQIGTRFAATVESSSHPLYKQAVIETEDNGTVLVLKKLAPVRLKKNRFALAALEAQQHGATREEELDLLGKKREMQGIFEGNLEEGELEMGQSSGLIKDILTAQQVVDRLVQEYNTALTTLQRLD